eukprot:TRINITY_DN11319_c0_g1_i1.p1 TRINITY_DN11319_c0_g1~~TRINITY_DN11319_c0_g1_i1.p1  ORF type:complete len:452 (+),score=45.79 TRINITY_DN11319_c0_g1_i1:75-1430(+)
MHPEEAGPAALADPETQAHPCEPTEPTDPNVDAEEYLQSLPAADTFDVNLSSRALSIAPTATLALHYKHITTLDLSRNVLKILPPAIGGLHAVRAFDISRNQLRLLPEEIRGMRSLEKLVIHANKLNHTSLPYDALLSLPNLQLFDVRYNLKCKGPTAQQAVRGKFPEAVEVLVTVPDVAKPTGGTMGGIVGAHACDRDAVLLRSQLEPWHTPKLRERLRDIFGIDTDVETQPRDEVMRKLLAAYEARYPAAEYPANRTLRRVATAQHVSDAVCEPLLAELKKWQAQRDPQSKERPTVRAEGYMILRSPLEFSNKTGPKAQLAAQKVARHQALWTLAEKVVEEVDPSFATQYTAVAFTDNFTGSPHIDTQNIGPFYGIALGEFTGGELCVESSPTEVTCIDTRQRLAKVDGRNPHWVAPFTGQRFSVIFYQTIGAWQPMTAAVHPPPDRRG